MDWLSSIFSVRSGNRMRLAGRLMAFLALAVTAVYIWSLLTTYVFQTPFQVHFINVGHGDAILLSCEDHHMLIDAGKKEYGSKVKEFLQKKGVSRLQYIVCTHEHSDHVGGMLDIVDSYSFDKIMAPTAKPYKCTHEFDDLLASLHKQGKKITVPKAGETFKLGSAQVTVIGPVTTYNDWKRADNHSLVLRVVYGDHSFLFTGDIYGQAESDIMDRVDVRSEVLKLSHHGAITSSSEEWLDAVKPQFAVISNKELSGQVKSRLQNRNIPFYFTGQDGNITFMCSEHGLKVKTSKW